jgi:hypothetical protein
MSRNAFPAVPHACRARNGRRTPPAQCALASRPDFGHRPELTTQEEEVMRWTSTAVAAVLVVAATSTLAARQSGRPASRAASPSDGYAIHVTAPHMISGQEMGPVHHYCKPIAPDPIIQCLLYDTPDPNAPLTGVEYIIAKKLTRPLVTRGTWNANFHDHTLEIASGRVKVLDMPPEDAKKVADLVSTTDGIIFNLWPDGDRIPTGSVEIGQSVGHRPMSADEYARRIP